MALIPVSRETHANLRVRPVTSFAFADKLSLARVTASEELQVAGSYPIVFARADDGLAPFAMLGLVPDENLFVSEGGQWLGSYIPAMVRRYPFFMAKPANGAESGDPVLLVDDVQLSVSEGEPLFGSHQGGGQDLAGQAMQMMKNLELEAAHMANLANALATHGLLNELPSGIAGDAGERNGLEGLYTVNEAKLDSLPDEAFRELRRSGALRLAYAQLVSICQVTRLQQLAIVRQSRARPS